VGRRTGDEIGRARLLPSQKRQRVASGEWRTVFSGGQRSCAAEKFSAHQEMRPPVFQPALAGFVFLDTDLKRVVGRGTRDEIGRARLLPSQKRQRVASGEWRIVFSGGQRSCAAEKFSAHQEMRPPVFQTALAGFVFLDTDLKRVVGRGTRDEIGRARLLPSRKRQRMATGN
jgi:hypothetical protein